MEHGAHRFRIGGSAAASLLINAAMIAAVLTMGMGRPERRADAPVLTVMSLALLKGVEDGADEAETAEPATPSAEPMTQPVAEPVPEQPHPPIIQPTPPPPIAAPAMLTRPAPAMAASSAAPAMVRAVTSGGPAASTAAPATPSARRGAADGLDANAPPGTSRSYAAKIRSWLYAHKIYPRRARMRREEGIVRVRFVIDRAGMLLEGVIVKGSGNGTLDEEAGAMMRRASPYPRAPADVPGDRIEFVAPIEFVLPV